MLLPARDQYHVGIVVEDFDAARDFLTRTSGYEWGPEIRVEYTMQTPEGPLTFDQHLSYSITEPRLELIQAAAGTPLQPTPSGLHHLGYWCEDVASTSRELVALGWAWECGGELPDGAPAWAYHLRPGGVRVELVSTQMKAGLESLWGDGAS